MSFSWAIPAVPPPGEGLRCPPFSPKRVRVVVPTFRDWTAARRTLESLLACAPLPREIVLVNDNPKPGLPSWVEQLPIRVLDYPGNRGPSFARNAGATLRTGNRIDWLYFTDTGCLRSPGFFEALEAASHGGPAGTVALGGPVNGVVGPGRNRSTINRYMTVETVLNPPRDGFGPQAIVTANAAVNVAAFRAAGGFDVTYPFAAGEDLDLGLKLRSIGSIGWVEGAVVRHRFLESIPDFRKRFRRYGAGTAHLESRWGFPSLRPVPFQAHERGMQGLADLQVASMQEGYDAHHQAMRRTRA